jgi:citrate lyase subunit beta/citryl-CoA lyase
VSSLLGATGPNVDVARELGFEFTPDGLETLYLRTRIILAARAAGLHRPVCGVWQEMKDLDGFQPFAEDNRRSATRALSSSTPRTWRSQNKVFTPSPEKVDFYDGRSPLWKMLRPGAVPRSISMAGNLR